MEAGTSGLAINRTADSEGAGDRARTGAAAAHALVEVLEGAVGSGATTPRRSTGITPRISPIRNVVRRPPPPAARSR